MGAREGGGTPLADVAEGGQDLGTGIEELGLTGGEVMGEAGGFEELVGGGAEFDFGAGLEAVLGEGGVGGGEFGVEEGGVEGEDALEAPFDAGELADEVVFEVVLGQEDAGDFFDEEFEGGVVFVTEDEEGAGVAAVFEGVEAGAGFALRGFGAAAGAPGVVAVVVVVEIHDSTSRAGLYAGSKGGEGGGGREGRAKASGISELGAGEKRRRGVMGGGQGSGGGGSMGLGGMGWEMPGNEPAQHSGAVLQWGRDQLVAEIGAVEVFRSQGPGARFARAQDGGRVRGRCACCHDRILG